MVVKARAIRQAEVDAREASAEAERDRREAAAKVRARDITHMRLTLWLLRYIWPRLTAEERRELRQIMPDEIEAEIDTALAKIEDVSKGEKWRADHRQ